MVWPYRTKNSACSALLTISFVYTTRENPLNNQNPGDTKHQNPGSGEQDYLNGFLIIRWIGPMRHLMEINTGYHHADVL